jgi:RHS repeat-associated protein
MRYIRAASTNQVLAQIDGSGNLSWYLTDNQGSVRDIVSAAGTTVTDHIDYGAFGNITLETNSAATGRGYLYTGLAEDRSTGIVQAQHRTLLVTTGQWMQEDPLGFTAGDPNLRRYVVNDVANQTDPSGYFGLDFVPHPFIGPPAPPPPLPPPADIVLSGHGKYDPTNGNIEVPYGTTVVVFCLPGASISNALGQLLDMGLYDGTLNLRNNQLVQEYQGPAEMPNFTLLPGADLHIQGNPTQVDQPTNLEDLLYPDMGVVWWAACCSIKCKCGPT